MIPIAYAQRIDRAHSPVIFCAPRGPAPATEAAGMERWHPKREATRQEQFILKRLETRRKLFGFLRRHRHEIFDDGFQAELESMYSDTGAGSDPVPLAQLAMALMLQGYSAYRTQMRWRLPSWTSGGRWFSAASERPSRRSRRARCRRSGSG